MGVRGLGQAQIKDRKETDGRILKFIRLNPGSYTKQIIKGTGMSPNAVVSSLKRLYLENQIIKHTESMHLKNIKIPKNAIGYVLNYKNNEIEKEEYIKYLNKQTDFIPKELKKLQIFDFKRKKPHVVELANLTDKCIKTNVPQIVKQMQNSLGINYIDSSMIGFYIFKVCEKLDLQHDEIPYAPEFYYRMLPRKFCYIDIPYSTILIDFINHNFSHPLDFEDLIEKKFMYFNKKTRELIRENFRELLKKRGYRPAKR